MSLHPTLRYDDPDTALAFLSDVLGLTVSSVARGEDGTVGHAEVWWDGGAVLLGPRREGQRGDPFDTGRAVLYLTLDDPDAHHDRVVAAGGEVVMGLTDQPYGSREFAVADPEGNRWCFGTYRPTP